MRSALVSSKWVGPGVSGGVSGLEKACQGVAKMIHCCHERNTQ